VKEMKVSEALIDRVVEEIRERNGLSGHSQASGRCKYDWKRGYEGERLHCVIHRHATGTDTVIVSRDTLADMRRHGVLTGMALVAADQMRSREPRQVEAACPHCRGEKRCPCPECIEGRGEVVSAPCRVCGGGGATKQWVQ
jgi:hypothetical protein